jgi:hypothetical protein
MWLTGRRLLSWPPGHDPGPPGVGGCRCAPGARPRTRVGSGRIRKLSAIDRHVFGLPAYEIIGDKWFHASRTGGANFASSPMAVAKARIRLAFGWVARSSVVKSSM